MALGYIIYQHVVAATAHHFNWDALNSLTLAIFQCQVPNFPQIWEEILSQPSDGEQLDAGSQLCTPPLLPSSPLRLTFVPPDTLPVPWEIHTQWSERELMALTRGTAKSSTLCQCIHSHLAGLKPALQCQHPWVHHLLRHCGPNAGCPCSASQLLLPPTPVSPMLLQTMRGIRQLQWPTPCSTSRRKLYKFISLSLCLAFIWPGLWQAFPFGVLMLPSAVALCRSAPLHLLFIFFYFKSLVHNLFRTFWPLL
jgi:hypothetical protein